MRISCPSTTTLGYTGAPSDPSGLVYLNARFYNPSIGSFQSHDPLEGSPGSPASFNGYAYAGGNPVTYRDPSGKCIEPVTFLFCLAAAVTAAEVGSAVANGAVQLAGIAVYHKPLSSFDWGWAASSGSEGIQRTAELGTAALGVLEGITTPANSDIFDEVGPSGFLQLSTGLSAFTSGSMGFGNTQNPEAMNAEADFAQGLVWQFTSFQGEQETNLPGREWQYPELHPTDGDRLPDNFVGKFELPDGRVVGSASGRMFSNALYAGRNMDFSNLDDPAVADILQTYPDLAEKYPMGVDFTTSGNPIFDPYALKGDEGEPLIAEIKNMKGDERDEVSAWRALGYIDPKYKRSIIYPDNIIGVDATWHHVEDMKTMIYLPFDLHEAVRHTGGQAMVKSFQNYPADWNP